MANNNHFELTLDTLAPTGSISGLKEFEKENKALTIVGGDATFKKVWFDDLNKNEVSKDCDGYKNAEWEAKDIAVTSAFNETGVYYYHLVLMDDVNNESEIYTLGPISYDQDAPVVKNVPQFLRENTPAEKRSIPSLFFQLWKSLPIRSSFSAQISKTL